MKKCTLVIIGIFIISFLNIKADVKIFGTNVCEDTYLTEEWADCSEGGYHTFYIHPTGMGMEKRALIKFKNIFKSDGGTIANGSTIESAFLKLSHYGENYVFNPGKFEIYRVKKAWGEGTLTKSDREQGAACWLQGKYGLPSSKWEIAGCDGENDRTQVPGGKGEVLSVNDGIVSFDIDITSIVKEWSNGEPNYGFIIISKGLGRDGNWPGFSFISRNDKIPNSSLLTIEYSASSIENTNWGKVKQLFR
ncbi:MAG: DNRLRE domain-containing protein [bacterium]